MPMRTPDRHRVRIGNEAGKRLHALRAASALIISTAAAASLMPDALPRHGAVLLLEHRLQLREIIRAGRGARARRVSNATSPSSCGSRSADLILEAPFRDRAARRCDSSASACVARDATRRDVLRHAPCGSSGTGSQRAELAVTMRWPKRAAGTCTGRGSCFPSRHRSRCRRRRA